MIPLTGIATAVSLFSIAATASAEEIPSALSDDLRINASFSVNESELPGHLYASRQFGALSEFTDFALKLAPYVIFSDPNHSKPAFDRFIGSDALRESMKNADRKCFAHEIPTNYVEESFIERIGSGELKPNEAAQIMIDRQILPLHNDDKDPLKFWTDLFKTIKQLSDAGVQNHFVDPVDEEEQTAYDLMKQLVAFYHGPANQIFISQHVQEETGYDVLKDGFPKDPEEKIRIRGIAMRFQITGGLQEKMNELADDVNEAIAKWHDLRFNDLKLAGNILDVADGECVIAYGAGHGKNNFHDADLDEHLGERDTVRIYIYGTIAEYAQTVNNPDNNGTVGKDHPELVFFADTKTVYATSSYLSALRNKLAENDGQTELGAFNKPRSPT